MLFGWHLLVVLGVRLLDHLRWCVLCEQLVVLLCFLFGNLGIVALIPVVRILLGHRLLLLPKWPHVFFSLGQLLGSLFWPQRFLRDVLRDAVGELFFGLLTLVRCA